MIRGLSNISAKGFPNNNGVHAVPMNETPDMAIIGSAVGSTRLINGRLIKVCLINGGSNFLISAILTQEEFRKRNFRDSKIRHPNWQTQSEQTALIDPKY